MNKRMLFAMPAVVLILSVALVPATQSALASPPQIGPQAPVGQESEPGENAIRMPITEQQMAEAEAFWTDDMIEQAEANGPPPGAILDGAPVAGGPETAPMADGPAMGAAGVLPGGVAGTAEGGFTMPSYGIGLPALTYPFPYINTSISTAFLKSFPRTTYGKMFFVRSGTPYSCSAVHITGGTGSRYLVLTSALCLRAPGPAGVWNSPGMTFRPAYYDGTNPYGIFTWNGTAIVGPAWITNTYWKQSWGMFEVGTSSAGCGSPTTCAGAEGIAWNQPAHQQWWTFAHPVGGGYTGGRLYSCLAPTAMQDAGQPGLGENPIGIGCPQVGALGGGWIIGARMNNYGFANSIFGYQYGGSPLAWFGPYLNSQFYTDWLWIN